ncbi:acetyl-CoA synthetase-like protein [Schizophyllum commune H4-8]|uniref:acetyl-CoA synthetase-like protein n=1 Tax=Schizophyllum commune (strain H4-8 / FGSC 9210) TaxID=578458 RepID=UPI00215E3A0D|nr:acetyl-CoA synthetase-like protein [Schizophyllum commune H4-8]KAI5884863.1 acetyl-CoA synthetase-like protein [Schizophyllum commune H4-8]
MAWIPKVSVEEAQRQLRAPGSLLETEEVCIDGRVLRTFKNLPPSCRALWLGAVKMYPEREFIVFEDQRYTFRAAHERASLNRPRTDGDAGDHVGLVARNLPDYLILFWACHLLGAVPVLVNALLPAETIKYCLVKCHCKLIVLDWERANLLVNAVDGLVRDSHATCGIVVIHAAEGKRTWKGIKTLNEELKQYSGDVSTVISADPALVPEDNAIILFTSGTTGLPKGALSTQRAFLSLLFNVRSKRLNLTLSTDPKQSIAGTRRAMLRRGEEIPTGVVPEAIGILLPVPLFHITEIQLMAVFGGAKLVLVRKYNPKQENVTFITAVPTIISDLIDLGTSELAGHEFATLGMGGAPVHNQLVQRAKKSFPKTMMAQGYGLTETNATATSNSAEDFAARPASCGLPTPVTDILIVDDDGKVLPPGHAGEIWVRGPQVMKKYYNDPAGGRGDGEGSCSAAIGKMIGKLNVWCICDTGIYEGALWGILGVGYVSDYGMQQDGWFKTGDVGVMCAEGFLYIRDRKKDMIIRGGENIDCLSIEEALYTEPGVLEAAAVGVPDERLGELPVAVVSVKQVYRGKVTEKSLLSLINQKLPRFAAPVMISVRDGELVHNAAGKAMKNVLRQQAAEEWEKRKKMGGQAKAKL